MCGIVGYHRRTAGSADSSGRAFQSWSTEGMIRRESRCAMKRTDKIAIVKAKGAFEDPCRKNR